MLDFLNKTPAVLQPLQNKLGLIGYLDDALVWRVVKSMAYSFTVTTVLTRGNFVTGLKSASLAFAVEASRIQFIYFRDMFKSELSVLPDIVVTHLPRALAFAIARLSGADSLNFKATALATGIPCVLAAAFDVPGLYVYGIVRA